MCENCMTYNKPDTIYYHAARKMLDYGFKLLSRVFLKLFFFKQNKKIYLNS
jgi:hypothetical protein